MDFGALDRHITGNWGMDYMPDEECAGCEDEENAPHTCDLAEDTRDFDDLEDEDLYDDFDYSLEYDEGGWD
jgi:hypothetical protein